MALGNQHNETSKSENTLTYILFRNKLRRKEVSRPISRVLSWTVIHLGAMSPSPSSDLPGSSAGNANGSLFGLAPSGVYTATIVTNGAVRSYRTFSPLPIETGGIFSAALAVMLPSPAPCPGVTWHSALWSPDFPPAACAASDCLAGSARSLRCLTAVHKRIHTALLLPAVAYQKRQQPALRKRLYVRPIS